MVIFLRVPTVAAGKVLVTLHAQTYRQLKWFRKCNSKLLNIISWVFLSKFNAFWTPSGTMGKVLTAFRVEAN